MKPENIKVLKDIIYDCTDLDEKGNFVSSVKGETANEQAHIDDLAEKLWEAHKEYLQLIWVDSK